MGFDDCVRRLLSLYTDELSEVATELYLLKARLLRFLSHTYVETESQKHKISLKRSGNGILSLDKVMFDVSYNEPLTKRLNSDLERLHKARLDGRIKLNDDEAEFVSAVRNHER